MARPKTQSFKHSTCTCHSQPSLHTQHCLAAASWRQTTRLCPPPHPTSPPHPPPPLVSHSHMAAPPPHTPTPSCHPHSHVAAHHPVRVCVHQQLHEGALVPPAHSVLHGLELAGVHVNSTRQLLDRLLLCQPACTTWCGVVWGQPSGRGSSNSNTGDSHKQGQQHKGWVVEQSAGFSCTQRGRSDAPTCVPKSGSLVHNTLDMAAHTVPC